MLTNYYDGCHVLCKTGALAEPVTNVGLRRNVIKPQSSAGYNIVLYGFIELDIGYMQIRESVCH